ncbi:MAG: histidine kinase dimerization/phosphoacceptor domain -containing protein [Pseudomonadota bacterium]
MGPSGWFTEARALLGKLRAQLAVIIAAALLPAGVVAVLQALANADQQLDQRRALLVSEAQLDASEERDLLVEAREAIRTAARNVALEWRRDSTCSGAFEALETAHTWSRRAVLLDEEGEVTCGSWPAPSVAGLSEWSNEFRPLPRFTIGPARLGLRREGESDELTMDRFMVAYQPVPGGAAEAFAIGVAIDITALSRLSEQPGEENPGRPFALVGNDGVLLVNGGEDGQWLPAEIDGFLSFRMLEQDLEGRDGVSRHYLAHPIIPGQVWALTGEPTLGFWDVAFGQPGIAIVTPILLWIIAISVAYVAIDRLVTRHVARLHRVTTRIGRGELDFEIANPDGAPLEIERLYDAIRRMAASLAERDTRLRELLSAQKSLLLEVHHRVKNNLQMVSSLMNIQIRRLPNRDAKDALQLVQDRIHGLALVHQNLYSAERLDHVALDQLARDVAIYLGQSFNEPAGELDFDFQLDEVTVDAATATPAALFLTEAVSNVFKHAVAPRRRLTVVIRLTRSDGEFALSVRNPAPLPALKSVGSPTGAAVSPQEPSGLGTRLMTSFAQQLSGTFERNDAEDGFTVTLRAPLREEPAIFSIRQSEAEAEAEVGAEIRAEVEAEIGAKSA